MRINKICLVVVTLVNLFATKQLSAMDKKPLTGSIDRESLIKSIWENELPKVQDEKPQIESGLCEVVFRYRDNNFVQKFSQLIGPHAVMLDEDLHTESEAVRSSLKVRTGYWDVCDTENTCMSTGNVYECVTIVVQHKNPCLVGMYHYFERDDKDFKKLHEFFDALKGKVAELSIDVSDFKVSLVSSYLSFNFLIIKRFMMANGFKINLVHAPLKACIGPYHYVESEGCSNAPGRLILANHSKLKIYHDVDSFGGYAPDPDPDPDHEDCCII